MWKCIATKEGEKRKVFSQVSFRITFDHCCIHTKEKLEKSAVFLNTLPWAFKLVRG